MRRYAPLIVLGVGFVILVLGIVNILPGMTGAGGSLIFLGALLFGLSFIPKPDDISDPPLMSAPERMVKVFFSPADVFRNLRRHPHWFAALLVMCILASAYLAAFTQRITPERIGNYVTDKVAESGFSLPPDAIAKMREDSVKQYKEPLRQVAGAINNFVGWFAGFAFLAAIYLVIVLAFGGNINFWQALAATIYSWFPIVVIHRVLSFVLLYFKDLTDIHPILGQQTLVTDNLGALLNPADSPVLWALAASIGILSFYQLWLAATGLKNAGEKVSGGTAWAAAIIVWVFNVALAVLSAALFPGFVS